VRIILSFLLLCCTLPAAAQPQPIGHWREHLPWNSAISIAATPNNIWCATPYALFSITNSETQRYSRISGLSETGISTIAYNPETDQLIIAYTNSNLDIIRRNDISNIPDIKRKIINSDKTIYHIHCFDKKAFLSSGLGVIVADPERNEIKDTWFVSNTGGFIRVNAFSNDNTYFYAATPEGLKRAPRTAANLADYRNWTLQTQLGPTECKSIVNLQDKMIALKNDSLFLLNGATWNFLYADDWPVISINTQAGKILLCQRKPNGASRILVLNANGSIDRTVQQAGIISFPRQATLFNNEVWIADQFGGCSRFVGSTGESYLPNSPFATASGQMIVRNNTLWVMAGEINEAWNYQYNRNGFYRFSNNEWNNFSARNKPALDTILDFIAAAVDPRDETLWAGSYGGGLVAFKPDGSLQVLKQNSPIGGTIGDILSHRVSGVQFDSDNNMWVSNYGAAQNFHVRKADGNWQSFTVPVLLNENATAQIVIDDASQKWIVSPKGNGLLCFNHGSSIENTGDDRWKLYRAGAGNGNLPANDVLCIAKDKEGYIWVGTTNGIGIIQCAGDVFTGSGCEAILPIVQQDRFAGFLFQGEEIRSMAVDGANRKWIATRNGVWLISADGEKTIYRFTEDNSPLLSNDVRQIAINGQSGEVYFATFKGICSFRSTATEGGNTNSDVLVFPNPVPPGYNGTIAIRGLVNNAIVKIIEPNGRLVFQTRALGGQAVWNGKDYKGGNIASGVYLVLVSDEGRQEKLATKIVFIAQ
jgi:hypothetical protein